MFEVKPRVGIVIWVYNMHQIRQLRRFGLIYYSSKKMKYVYLYVDQSSAEAVKRSIEKLHFVRKVELSHRPDLITEFGDKIEKSAENSSQDPLLKETVPAEEKRTDPIQSEQRSSDNAHHIR